MYRHQDVWVDEFSVFRRVPNFSKLVEGNFVYLQLVVLLVAELPFAKGFCGFSSQYCIMLHSLVYRQNMICVNPSVNKWSVYANEPDIIYKYIEVVHSMVVNKKGTTI